VQRGSTTTPLFLHINDHALQYLQLLNTTFNLIFSFLVLFCSPN
jgi:hypothetical protein